MPAAEALACGATLVCARSSALPEVAGEAAIYCDPESVNSIATALRAGADRRAAAGAAARVGVGAGGGLHLAALRGRDAGDAAGGARAVGRAD